MSARFKAELPRFFLIVVTAVLWMTASAVSSTAGQGLYPARQISGGEFDYEVKPGDSLRSLSSRCGVSVANLAVANHLSADARLIPRSVIRIDNRHIPPGRLERGILINVSQRMLFFFDKGEMAGVYPVAVGKPGWRTKLGTFKVVAMVKDPTWVVPESIQIEMEDNGKEVLTLVPPGPDNPLGRYAIYLSIPGYLVHGTNAPLSIYSFRTHGCVRLHPDDARALFGQVKVGDNGEIVDRPVLMAVLSDGRILVEINKDVLHREPDPIGKLRAMAEAAGVTAAVDWSLVEQAVARSDGVAREVEISRKSQEPAPEPKTMAPGSY